MGKTTVNKIVSLILEQINAHTTEDFAPDKFTFIDSLEKYEDVFFGKDGVEDQNQPVETGVEAEVDEMAQPSKHPIEKLPEPLRIPVNMLTKGSKTPYIPRIVTLDPITNEMVEGVVITDEYHTMPNGDRVLRFYNYGEELKVDRAKRRLRYVVLPENRFMADLPRSTAMGTQYVRPDYETAPPNEPRYDKEKREKRLLAIKEANAKRYGIFPVINDMFSKHEVLDHLDICLIPEAWATSRRTEHTTNKIILKKFGGASPEIDADFYAARDILNINDAVNNVLDLRADLALGAIGQEGQTFDINRPREASSHVPRRHANYIYTKGGNWAGKQRVHDPNFFQRAGGKTMVYHLNSKNIQEGLKELNVESVLHLAGNIVETNYDNDYILTATFTATLNARNLTSGSGEDRGPLIQPVTVSLLKPLPEDYDPATFNLDKNMEFFVNEGRTRSSNKSGFLPALIDRLGNAILETIDPDDVQQRIVQLAQEAVEENA